MVYAIYTKEGNFVGLTESSLEVQLSGNVIEEIGENTAQYLTKITQDYRAMRDGVTEARTIERRIIQSAIKPWDGSPIIKEDIFGNKWRSA